MRALLAEYTVSHDPSLAPEGAAMLAVLSQSFIRCGYDVVSPGAGDFGDEIARLAPSCDVGLVIAPDHLLSRYTMILEQHTHNIGCGAMSAAVCANKVHTAKILRSHGIPVPDEMSTGRRVVKPVNGCGAAGVRLTEEPTGPKEFGQRYIEGEHISVSLVGSRVVGDACMYFSGAPPLVLALNRQSINVGDDGVFHYLGGETPVDHPRLAEIADCAKKTAEVLGCQGYCGVDVVVSDRVYVVDVNARITTSLVGIAACMKEEIAEILVAASKGEPPAQVHLSGTVKFDKAGKVTAA
ncbi:MAG: ATP-grasp domain-containing protein [Methanoregula sp.]|nr:MAG: ATP-grasp domain-containing protein [Methanoregula sp.]